MSPTCFGFGAYGRGSTLNCQRGRHCSGNGGGRGRGRSKRSKESWAAGGCVVELPVDADAAWQEDEAEASRSCRDQCSAMNPPKLLEQQFPRRTSELEKLD
ncbi:unnamed protein product [Symbiodinium natans]|uniref:Uncharacterized protein n=1 Tax=Symbiodinium natans TaxID=878477 RepID=A0A812KCA9_9DINO|nr:unnamed protein product [Symbiodinium natans]